MIQESNEEKLKLEVINCFNKEVIGYRKDYAELKSEQEAIKVRVNSIEKSHGMILDTHGKVSVLYDKYDYLKGESDKLREARHEHANQIMGTKGQISTIESVISDIKDNQTNMNKAIESLAIHQQTTAEKINQNSKLIGWGGTIIAFILVTGIGIIGYLLRALLNQLGLEL